MHRKRKLLKKIIISALSVVLFFAVVFLAAVVLRGSRSVFGREDGKIVIFDSQVRQILAKVDRGMGRGGYVIGEKSVETQEMLPYNGVNMRLVKVTGSYVRPAQVVSHEKTAYQRMLSGLETIFGRLPAPFYALDIVKYEGEREEVSEEIVVECRFMLIEDGKNRLFGDGFYAYAGTMERRDVVHHGIFDEEDRLLGEYDEKSAGSGRHFDGDLGWLKAKAYGNYVSPIMLTDAFEWYE